MGGGGMTKAAVGRDGRRWDDIGSVGRDGRGARGWDDIGSVGRDGRGARGWYDIGSGRMR